MIFYSLTIIDKEQKTISQAPITFDHYVSVTDFTADMSNIGKRNNSIRRYYQPIKEVSQISVRTNARRYIFSFGLTCI